MSAADSEYLNANAEEMKRLREKYPGLSATVIQRAIITHGPTRQAVEAELARLSAG
jgi:hypothetical protein